MNAPQPGERTMNTAHRFSVTVQQLKATLGLPAPIAQQARLIIVSGGSAETVRLITRASQELRNQLGH